MTQTLATAKQIAYATALAAELESDAYRRRAHFWPTFTVARMSEEINDIKQMITDHEAWGCDRWRRSAAPLSAEDTAVLDETWS